MRYNTIVPFVPVIGFLYLIGNLHWEINHADESVLDSSTESAIVGVIQGISLGFTVVIAIITF